MRSLPRKFPQPGTNVPRPGKNTRRPEVAIENMELEQMIAASGDLLIDIDKDTTGDPLSADSRLFEDFLF